MATATRVQTSVQQNSAIYHFNRGIISRLALARLDLKRTAFSAEQMKNWMPRVLGSMMPRPGMEFLGGMSSAPRMLPFVFSTNDTALIELTDKTMRLWIDDALLSRPFVSTAVNNPAFELSLAGWTLLDEPGAATTWEFGGFAKLVGNGTAAAIMEQHVTPANAGTEHALRVVIERGPVTFMVGATSGSDEYVTESDLATGTHSLSFTPFTDFFIRFRSRLARMVLVASCSVEGPGAVTLPTPWAATDLRKIRTDQSADVIFAACQLIQQRRIERRAKRSWSVVLYQSDNGPFRVENTGPITIAPTAFTGNVTLNASKPLFKPTQIGTLFKIRSTGQRVSSDIATENTFTDPVQVTGVGESRRFTWTIDGTWTGTVTLQRSIGAVGFWEEVATRTSNDSQSDNDHLDNQIVYYRLGFKAGDYGSGIATCTITYTLGSITGIARVTLYLNPTAVDAEVLKNFGGTDPSEFWSESEWSDRRGWPTAVTLYEGRLWWAGKKIWGSVSDAFDSFDEDLEGDAGPINRTIGSGPIDNMNWLLPMQRLLLGAEGSEISIRSTTFDEPLSPTNFNLKAASTQGSAPVPAVKIDSRGIFVQRGGSRVYELAFDSQAFDYGATDLTTLTPEMGLPGIVAMAVQRQPDTRIHCLRSNGTVALAVIDRVENVLSWQEVITSGVIEEVVTLPGPSGVAEDSVYYVVQRALGNTGVTALTVTAAGSGYTSPPALSFEGGGGNNASATCTLQVMVAAIAAPGAGYVPGNTLTVVGGTAAVQAVLQVATVDGAGGVLTVTITNGGSYSAVPSNSATVTGGSGVGFTVNATWGVGTATVASSGSGYVAVPTVHVTGGGVGAAITATIGAAVFAGHYLEKWALESECRGGVLNKQADCFVVSQGATAAVSSGFVSSLSVLSGAGYTNPPTLTFAGGGGSGAAATVGLQLVEFSLFNLGSGYSRGDVLTLAGGTFTRPAQIEVLSVFGGGQINGGDNLVIVDPGEYTAVPGFFPSVPVTVTGGTGFGATIAPCWGLADAHLTNPGSGYSTAPIVTVSNELLSTVPPGNTRGLPGSVSASVTVLTETTSSTLDTITGLNHLEGREVVVWADGIDLSPTDDDGVQTRFTVTGGAIALPVAVSRAVVGLPYKALWVSTKLGLQAGENAPLTTRRRISQLGVILQDAHIRSLRYGNSNGGPPAVLDALPLVEAGEVKSVDTIYEGYDADLFEFPGEWATDNRLWLEVDAPRPCTLLAVVMAMQENVKS
jgi:hypothetical protein